MRSSSFTSGHRNKRIWSRDSSRFTRVHLRLHRDFPMVSSQGKRRLRRGSWVVLHDALTAPRGGWSQHGSPSLGRPGGTVERESLPGGRASVRTPEGVRRGLGELGESCSRSYLTSIDTSPDNRIFQASMKHLPRQTTCWALKQAQQV